MPIRMVCNWVYSLRVAGMDAEARDEFDTWLVAPPEGWEAVEDAVEQAGMWMEVT